MRIIKILIITISAIFLIVFCIIVVLLGILHYKASQTLSWDALEGDRYASIGYYCRRFPPSKDWIECAAIKGAWKYLEKEKVQKIYFCYVGNLDLLPDKWRGCEITEPNKIEQILQSVRNAKKDDNGSAAWLDRMKIITNKHKFIIPVGISDKNIYGYEWTSPELPKLLQKWGLILENKHDFPLKAEIIAILLYPLRNHRIDRPVAIFGDKKYVEEQYMRVGITREDNKLFKPNILFESREWIEKIAEAYERGYEKNKEKEKRLLEHIEPPIGEIRFITPDGFYGTYIRIDANAIYDNYIKSEQLKAYFDELGLTKELLAEKP